ncbi:hypothetical protein P4647_23395 [Peribacillus frigoritolerans]|uniref:hypothetical protein n=1 Tax=Peribacillus frigoritolerans TaxID=450367 RepID=UPI002E20E62C|nr:hypothetical protein [Peribacillus frigoritolerans]
MAEQVIRTADLRKIEGSLRTLEHGVTYVTDQVNMVNAEVQEAKMNLDQLIQEFQDYVRKDQLEKNVQLAETRLVKVRQEIKTNFGHYGEIRRGVTGILQAVDVSLIKKETIENTTEEHMLAAPRYWLAPCLIALSAWLNNNQELAEKAMMEGLRRDDEKTSLFFALVTRRGARYKASREWLERYFALQDPYHLEREIVILIDGFTNGIFGPDSRTKCEKQIESWIQELSQKAGFVEEQLEQWKNALEAKLPENDPTSYPYLSQYSPTWPQLEKALQGAKLHKIIHDYFESIFAKEITPEKSIAFAVDALLDTLVSKFDHEELPLRRDERLLSLIIEERGDRNAAQKKFDDEKTLEEDVSFTQLLTNFAMFPEVSNASVATQKLSIALSKDWIRGAHDDITAANRASVPVDVEITIDQWNGKTQDGKNEQDLLHSLENHINTRRDQAIEQAKLSIKHWVAIAGGILFTLMGISATFLFVFAGILFLYFFLGMNRLQKHKIQLAEEFSNLLNQSREVLLASLAEVVDWRNEYSKEDSNASSVTTFLDDISPDQYSFSNYDSARSVIR